MQLEDYFTFLFLTPNDIRIRGTRVGIETVLYEYIHEARPPEEIAARYDTVTLEQVYATVLYYLHNRPAVEQYLTEWLEFSRQAREEQDRNPSPGVQRLRALLRECQAARSA